MPNGDKTVEQLHSEVSELENLYNELKTKTLSNQEREEKERELKDKAEKLQGQIDRLAGQEGIDAKLATEKERAEAILKNCNDTVKLKSSIVDGDKTDKKETSSKPISTETNQASTQTETQNSNAPEEEKGFFGKTGEWIGNQWDDVWSKEKRKEEGGKNLLRTAGFVATGVGAVALAYKGVKKLWNRVFGDKEDAENDGEKEEKKSEKKKKKKKSDGETSRWKKFLIGAGITTGTVIGGVEIYKHRNRISSWFKEKLGLALPFDEARQKVEGEVRNGKIDDDHFGVFQAHFDGITYDENTQEICSYGQKTKIEKNGKKLQGMDGVEFASWEELIHAANIVNFAKRTLRGRGNSSSPFIITDRGGDIAFNCSASGKNDFMKMNGGKVREWILGTLGTVGGGILGGYCAGTKGAAIGAVGGGAGGYALGAYIDNSSAAGRCCGTIARGANLDLFKNYLNRQTDENGKSLWEQGEEVYKPDNETPIHKYLNEVKREIADSHGDADNKRRDLEIEWNESNPKEYTIKSYYQELKMTIEGGPTKKGEIIDCNKITKIHIEKYDEYDSRGDGLDIDFPHNEEGLKEAIKTANLTNKIVEEWKLKGGEKYPFAYGKYISGKNVAAFNLDIDTPGLGTNLQGGTCILTNDKLKKRYPTIHKDLGKYDRSAIFGTQEKKHDQAIQDKPEGSQYIKFLHQIGKGNFWKK